MGITLLKSNEGEEGVRKSRGPRHREEGNQLTTRFPTVVLTPLCESPIFSVTSRRHPLLPFIQKWLCTLSMISRVLPSDHPSHYTILVEKSFQSLTTFTSVLKTSVNPQVNLPTMSPVSYFCTPGSNFTTVVFNSVSLCTFSLKFPYRLFGLFYLPFFFFVSTYYCLLQTDTRLSSCLSVTSTHLYRT